MEPRSRIWPTQLDATLATLVELLRGVAVHLGPVTPKASARALQQLDLTPGADPHAKLAHRALGDDAALFPKFGADFALEPPKA